MANYSKKIPVDMGGASLPNNPAPLKALQVFGANITASSVVTLHENATDLEVAAGNAGVAIRWVATSDTQASVVTVGATANFDHIVPANEWRRFTVPVESTPPGLGGGSVVGLNTANGLYRRVAWNTLGASSSVYGTTY